MKFFKSLIRATIAALALASVSFASAATIVDANGSVVRGTSTVRYVEKDTSAGFNRVAVRYTSGVQYHVDDAGWSRYGQFVAALADSGVAVPGSATARVYNVGASNGIYCISSQSAISFPDVGQTDYLGDGCAFWQAVKAVSK